MAQQASLQYDSLPTLDHFRLLELHPGSEGGPIGFSLHTVSFSDHPDYEALSYVWGDPTVTRAVSCDSADFRITVNLYDALAELRLADQPRTLWADAVCINQSDLDEKASQVGMMHRIYESSRQCVVWLGQGDAHSDVALDIVSVMSQIVCEKVGVEEGGLDEYLQANGRHPFQAREIGFNSALPGRQSKEWEHLSHFLCRPWFSRVWVVQEVYLSRDVIFHCGARATFYAALFYTADWLITNQEQLDSEVRKTDAFSTVQYNIMHMRPDDWVREKQSLASLLDRGRRFQATDPRDKVYGLMHLPAFGREYPDLEPNYRLAAVDVYSDVVFRIIAGSKDLFVLTHAGSTGGGEDDIAGEARRWPSWVPNWQNGNDQLSSSSTWYQFYSAGTSERAAAAMAVSRTANHGLVLRGLAFDVVEDVCDLAFHGRRVPDMPDVPTFTPTADSAWRPYQLDGDDPATMTTPYPAAPAIVNAYAMALTGGCRAHQGFFPLRCGPENAGHHGADLVAWLQWTRLLRDQGHAPAAYPPGLYAPDRPTLTDASAAEAAAYALRYGKMVVAYMAGRDLVRTRRGYLGNAPRGTRRGDVVAVLAGGAVPFVLRPGEEEGGEGFRLVGDAYLHGIMDGEAVKDWESVEKEVRDFCIY